MKTLVSFVIPCYRSEATLPGVIREIQDTMEKMKDYGYEIVLVNDCSPDGTFSVIRKLCQENDNIVGIDLARNFGQHSALMAGFHYVKGDVIVCLDDDGQTPADEADRLLMGIEKGADVVYARYGKKHHSGFRNWGSHVDEMMRYEFAYPYVIGLVLRTTKNIINVDVEHRDRQAGVSGYTIGKLLNLWFNGFTAFSVKPLRIATVTGAGVYGRNDDADAGAFGRVHGENVYFHEQFPAVCDSGVYWRNWKNGI